MTTSRPSRSNTPGHCHSAATDFPRSPDSRPRADERGPAALSAVPLGSGFDGDVHGGRDRDRFIERSMGLVMLYEIVRLRLAGSGKPEQHVDPLKDGGVAAMTDGFNVDLDLLEAHA
jgi:hypothetical protein